MNRNKATIILILVTIGYLATYPFRDIFILGFLSSGFCAAMIGGFADWYGITALFRKPLGIPWKTEIISRSRKKIFDGLTDMVVGELITESNMRELISKQNFSSIIVTYWDNGMDDQIKNFLNNASEEILSGIGNPQNEDELERIIIENISKIPLHKVLLTIFNIFLENDYEDKIFDFLIEEGYKITESSSFEVILLEAVDNIKSNYENGMLRRKFVNYVVLDTILNMSSNDIAGKIKLKLQQYILSLKDIENVERQQIKTKLYDKLFQYLKNDGNIEAIEKWKVEQLKKISFVKYLKKLYEGSTNIIDEKNNSGKVKHYINKNIDTFAKNFKEKEGWKSAADDRIKKYLLDAVKAAHQYIEKLVRENLNNYSDKMLVELVEEKAGNDLQLIRINGSVVGGLVGMLAFIVSYFVG